MSISEEDKKVLDAFHALKLKPSKPIENAEELVDFMEKFGKMVLEDKKSAKPEGIQYPKISMFFGEKGKGEVNYPTWRFEVDALLKEGTFKEDQMKQGIRRSCKGNAGDILRRMGADVSLAAILDKFHSVFGNIDSTETVMRQLYSCRQQDNESVISYASRVEELFAKAVEIKQLKGTDEQILKGVFYAGLKHSIKTAAAYKFDTVGDYDKFKIEMRKLENETLANEGSAQVINAQATNMKTEKSEMGEVRDLLKKMNHRIDELENKLEPAQASTSVGRGEFGYGSKRGNYSYGSHRGGYNRGHWRGRGQARGQGRPSRPLGSETFKPKCYKCDEVGHIKRDCPKNQ